MTLTIFRNVMEIVVSYFQTPIQTTNVDEQAKYFIFFGCCFASFSIEKFVKYELNASLLKNTAPYQIADKK